MQIKKTVRLQGGVYHSEVSLGADNPISAVEQEAIDHFGPLEVEVGGVVSVVGQTVTLDARTVCIPGSLPVKQTFDLKDYPQAEDLAHAWADLVKNRISVALNALLVKDAGSLGTTEENVLPTPGDREEDPITTSEWMNL